MENQREENCCEKVYGGKFVQDGREIKDEEGKERPSFSSLMM